MSKKTIQKVIYALVVVLLLMGSFFAGRLLNKPIDVQAQEDPGGETRATQISDCDIDNVAIYSDKALIKCSTPIFVDPDTVYYFAIANTKENEMLINRVMAIGLTNMSMDRHVYVSFDTLPEHNPSGCHVNDCRKLLAVNGYK